MRARLGIGVVTLGALATCQPDCPLPSEFDGAFAKGTVCMPTAARTAAGSEMPAPVPVRFDVCLLSCVSVVPGTESMTYFFQCAGDQCEMVLLATGRLAKAAGQSCDGCQLADPPASACTQRSVSFLMEPPHTVDATGKKTYQAKSFVVRVPYLTLTQAEAVQRELKVDRDVSRALTAAGVRTPGPGRSFTVTFSPQNPAAPEPSRLSGADCHRIELP